MATPPATVCVYCRRPAGPLTNAPTHRAPVCDGCSYSIRIHGHTLPPLPKSASAITTKNRKPRSGGKGTKQ